MAINKEIAESLGYMDIYRCGQSLKRTEQGLLHGKLLCGTRDQPSPNYGREYELIKRYTRCLNACREAFDSLCLVDQIEWHKHLRDIVRSRCAENIDDESVHMLAVNALAIERAEAHVRTIRK